MIKSTKTHTYILTRQRREEKKQKNTQSSKIYTVVKIAQGNYRTGDYKVSVLSPNDKPT